MPSIYRNGIKYSGAGGTYTAGEGIDIANNEISVDTDDIQEKLVSGTNIKTINNNSLLGSGNINIQTDNKNVWFGRGSEGTPQDNEHAIITTTSGNFTLDDGNIVYAVFQQWVPDETNVYLNVDNTRYVAVERVVTADDEMGEMWEYGETVGFVYDDSFGVFRFIKGGIASTTNYGATKLSSSTSSTSTVLAATSSAVKSAYDLANGKQDALVSGTNIKTINNNSLLGSGNISISSSSKNVWYGTSDTDAATVDKVATTSSGDFTLTTGNIVYIKMTNANTATNPTLNVDGTGAKDILQIDYNIHVSDCFWRSGEVVGFVYNGTNFVILDGGIATTSVYGVTKLSSSTSSTSTALAATPSAVKTAYDLAATKSEITTTTASLTSTGWTNNAKTVSVTGVTASNSVLVTPAPDSMDDYASCGIKCTAQAAGTLTFSCTTVPSSTITVNVMIID